MAGQEEIFSITGDVSGVLDALDAMESGMLKGEDALKNLADAFNSLDTAGAPLDQLATLMGALDEQLLASGFSTREFDSALGALRDTAGQAAAVVDTLTSASLSDAEAFTALTAQTRDLAQAQAMAFAALDRATASEEAQAAAMDGLSTSMASAQSGILGLGTGFANLDSQIALYDESIATTDSQTVALARSTGIATEEQLKLAEALLRDATFLDADAESVNLLAERYGLLAESMGQAISVEAPLVQQTIDWAAAATEAAAAAEREAQAASQMTTHLTSAGSAATTAAADIQETVVSVDDLLASGKSMAEIMAMFDNVAAGADTMKVAVQEANTALEEIAAATNTAASALDREAARLVAAADAARILAEANTQAAQAALEMATAQGAAADTIGALQVKADAAAAAQARLAGAEDEAGASAGSANAGFGMSGFMLLMLAMMALQAGKAFLDMGMNFDDTMTIIQGKTQASDQQIQDWTASLQAMSAESHISMDVLAQGLDTVTAAGFRATDATTVLQQGMELARATGSGLVESTNLLTASLNAYGQTSASAADYAQQLFAAIANGKQNVQELTSMLGSTIDTAAAAGISFHDLVDAETLFSKSSVDSSIAARDFQTFIAAIAADSNMTAAQVKKLSDTFDSAKFSTLDWAGKLEMLGKISGNNVGEFNQLIGGADAAKNALAILGISTDQLAKNAKAAGLSFDPILYDSLKTASEKLLYLDQVSGGSEAHLKKLTVDGVHPLNDALAALDLKVSDVSAQFAKTHPAFNQAAFDSLDLKDKLLTLWNAVGGDITQFASFIGGTKNLGEAASIMGINLKDGVTGAEHFSAGMKAAAQQMRDFADSSDPAIQAAPRLQSAYDGVVNDLKSKTEGLGASLSSLSHQFVVLISPALEPMLSGISSALDFLGQHALLADAVMLTLATVIGGVLVLALGAGTIALWGWVAAATAAAIANIAAFWEIYLVVALIAVAIVGVIEVVQHWGAIVSWLAGIWGAFASWFMGIFGPAISYVGGLFQALGVLIGGIFSAIVGFLSPVVGIFQAIGGVIAGVVNPAFAQLGGVLTGSLLPAWQGLLQAGAAIGQTFSSLAATVMGVLAPAWAALMAVLTPLLPILRQINDFIGSALLAAIEVLAIAIGSILVTAISLLIAAFVGIIAALAYVIVGIVQFVAGIIQIFTGMVQIVIGIFQLLVTVIADILAGNWGKIGADAAAAWNTIMAGINNVVAGGLMVLTGLFNMTIGAVIALFTGFVNTLIAIATGLYNALVGHSIFPDMMNAILQLFTQLASQGPQIMQMMAQGVVSAFLAMATQSVQPVISLASNVINWFENMYNTVVGHSIMSNMQAGVASSFQQMSSSGTSTTASMANSVDGNFASMNNSATSSMNSMSASALRAFQNMNTGVTGQMQMMDKNTIDYFNSIGNYVDAKTQQASTQAQDHIVNMHRGLEKNFDEINTSTQATIGDMSKVVPQDFANLSQASQASMSTLSGNINTIFLNMKTTAISSVEDMVSTITDRFTALQLNASLALTSMGSAANQQFGRMRDDAIAAVSQMGNSLNQHFGQMRDDAISAITQLASSANQHFGQMRDDAISAVSAMSSTIVGIFHSMQGGIAGVMSSVQATVDGTFSQIAGAAFGYGSSTMGNYVSGLNSQMGALRGAMANAASIVADNMPHSPAKEGPLRDIDKSMPALIDMFVRGLRDGSSRLQAASAQTAQAVGSGFLGTTATLNSSVAAGGIGGGNSPVLLSQILTTLQEIARQQGSTNVTSGPSVTNMFSGTLMPGISQTQMWQIINAVGGMMMESGARGATQQGAR